MVYENDDINVLKNLSADQISLLHWFGRQKCCLDQLIWQADTTKLDKSFHRMLELVANDFIVQADLIL